MTLQQIEETALFLRTKHPGGAKVGIVLGTGLNDLTHHMETETVVDYADIPHFPRATVAFHQGKLLFGRLEGVPVMAMQGRFHYYEGYSMQQVTFPVRVMHALGVGTLLTSNAAGGMNPAFRKGDLVITEDHINMLPDNPLRGLGAEFGNRFTDMSCPYDTELQGKLVEIFGEEGLPVHKGVYVAVMGPNLETRAEYRYLRNSGADMVGMSTVPEIIVANQLGMACASVSVITDECDPDHLQPVDIAEIIHIAGLSDKKLSLVFKKLVSRS